MSLVNLEAEATKSMQKGRATVPNVVEYVVTKELT